MKLLRKILIPFNILYFLVVWCRNKCYDYGLFPSKSYTFPVISIGNLSVGGNGKTPMVEFIIQLLKSDHNLAVLSRGYGRKTSGFLMANAKSTAQSIGDEPFQLLQKFPEVIIAVDANRQRGIEMIRTLKPLPEIIILDDAFQHRKVTAGLSILLTTFSDLYSDDLVLPAGNLREPRSGARRAQVVMVTKCPNELSSHEKNIIRERLDLSLNQYLFFSSINYSDTIYSKSKAIPLIDLKLHKFTLVTGIANAFPLITYLKNFGLDFDHLEFADHHEFSKSELNLIQSKDLVLTTEKDFSRLQSISHNQLYYLPISIHISESDKFNEVLKNFVSEST